MVFSAEPAPVFNGGFRAAGAFTSLRAVVPATQSGVLPWRLVGLQVKKVVRQILGPLLRREGRPRSTSSARC